MKENENESDWALEIGFYPGVLLGIRTYEELEQTTRTIFTIYRL